MSRKFILLVFSAIIAVFALGYGLWIGFGACVLRLTNAGNKTIHVSVDEAGIQMGNESLSPGAFMVRFFVPTRDGDIGIACNNGAGGKVKPKRFDYVTPSMSEVYDFRIQNCADIRERTITPRWP